MGFKELREDVDNLTLAVSFKIITSGDKTYIQLYDENENEVDGSCAFWDSDFDCRFSGLTTLEGVPIKVHGSFDCSYNKLTSLSHSPKYVEGSFICECGFLTTLEGCPEVVYGIFDCSDNELKNLIGAPKKVSSIDDALNGTFHCYGNPLESIEGIPLVIEGNCVIEKKPMSLDELRGVDIGGYVIINGEKQDVPKIPTSESIAYFLERGRDGIFTFGDISFVVLQGTLFVYNAEKILSTFRLSRWPDRSVLIKLLVEEYCSATH